MVISLKLKLRAPFAVVAAAGFLLAAGCAGAKNTGPDLTAAPQASAQLTPGPNDPRIAYMTARLLEEMHYLQEPLDKTISKRFFDQYVQMLDVVDGQRENFLQSDLDEFASYRTNLGDYTVGSGSRADLTPAYVIFGRFEQRLEQHTAYVTALLKQNHFTFDTDERVTIDRDNAPWPKDLAEAQKLWRQELELEFLQERLDREISKTNAAVVLSLPKEADREIADDLLHRYSWRLRSVTNWDSGNVLQVYLDALAHAYDPHSDYLNNENAQNFSISMGLTLFGIGAELGEDEGNCKVESLVPGGPAKLSKQIQVGDDIVAVAQSNQPPVNVVDMDLPKVVDMIRGPKGTQVRLTVTSPDHPTVNRVVTLVRDEIKLEDEHASADLIQVSDGHGGAKRIGVIDLPSFYAPIDVPGNEDHSAENYTTMDVAKLIKRLKQEKVSGIILDLRNNPGGSLDEAVNFTGLFIKDGPVVLARNPDGQVVVYSDSDPGQLYAGPLVVLVNRLSASAAEIATAALQDYGRALVVGDSSTFGKGTVQDLTSLRPFVWPATPSATNDPGIVKITIRKFYRVTGASTQLKGVIPDIVLPDPLSYSTEIGESNLQYALPWDTISSVPFNKFNRVQPYLPLLQAASDERVATNQDFIYARQDIDDLKKLQADPTEPLNERQALQERQKLAERELARAAERAVRPVPDETKYEITMENIETNGLPAPTPLLATNQDVTLFDTNANGSVTGMTTNQDLIVGIKLNSNDTNASVATVVTQPPPDAMLDETERILEDYISLSSSNHPMVAN